MIRRLFNIGLALAVLLSAGTSWAVEPNEVLADPALEMRARELSKNLRCLVCQNQTIDDSNADLAKDLRLVVRERLSDALARAILALNPIVTVVGCVAQSRFREYGDWQRNVFALGALSLVLIVATIIRLHRIVGPTKE